MKILSISARLDDAVRTRIGNVSIDGVEGRLKTVSRCNVLVIWNRNSDDTESKKSNAASNSIDVMTDLQNRYWSLNVNSKETTQQYKDRTSSFLKSYTAELGKLYKNAAVGDKKAIKISF